MMAGYKSKDTNMTLAPTLEKNGEDTCRNQCRCCNGDEGACCKDSRVDGCIGDWWRNHNRKAIGKIGCRQENSSGQGVDKGNCVCPQ